HFPSVFIPRVIHHQPEIALNADPPVLIDANFSTAWSNNPEWSPLAMFALLNSSWMQLCMEAIGTPMGGGALKLEATQIRRLPLPDFPSEVLRALHEAGSALRIAAAESSS